MNGNDIGDIGALCAVVGVAAIVIDDDESDNEDFEERWRRLRSIHLNAEGFRNLDDVVFRQHFRVNRQQFEKLVTTIGKHLEEMGRLNRLRTPLDLCLMMSLWILASQDTFRSVAVKFAVPSRGTVHYHYTIVIECMREMAPRFIQWPDRYERDNIKGHFERKYGYPGVVGCIDGTHIYISAPLIQAQRYVNRFRKHSILLQAVSDHKLVFRDIYVGQPGSVHDARMFQRSPLSHNLLHNEEMLSLDEHVIGDGAYTLTDKLLTPYRDIGDLNRRKRRHNYTHASARSAIERTFALYKGRWRRMKSMLAYSLNYVIDTIIASCVLHNFILLEGQPYDHHQQYLMPAINDDNHGDGDALPVPENDPALDHARVAGRHKRDFIAYTIYPYVD